MGSSVENLMFFMGFHELNGGFMGYEWNLEDLRLRLVGDDFFVNLFRFFFVDLGGLKMIVNFVSVDLCCSASLQESFSGSGRALLGLQVKPAVSVHHERVCSGIGARCCHWVIELLMPFFNDWGLIALLIWFAPRPKAERSPIKAFSPGSWPQHFLGTGCWMLVLDSLKLRTRWAVFKSWRVPIKLYVRLTLNTNIRVSPNEVPHRWDKKNLLSSTCLRLVPPFHPACPLVYRSVQWGAKISFCERLLWCNLWCNIDVMQVGGPLRIISSFNTSWKEWLLNTKDVFLMQFSRDFRQSGFKFKTNHSCLRICAELLRQPFATAKSLLWLGIWVLAVVKHFYIQKGPANCTGSRFWHHLTIATYIMSTVNPDIIPFMRLY